MPFKIDLKFDEKYKKNSQRQLNNVEINYLNDDSIESVFEGDLPNTISAKIEIIKKLNTKWKEVYIIRLNNSFDYYPGDCVGIVAPNEDKLVIDFFKACSFDYKIKLEINRSGLSSFYFKGSLYDFIRNKMDLKGLPKKSMLMNLAKTSSKREYLEFLCSPEGTNDYLSLVTNYNTIVDLIKEFDCKPSLNDILENCNLIKPRYYTLINHSDIILGILSKSDGVETRYGQVSGFINEISDKDGIGNVNVIFRKNELFSNLNEKKLFFYCTGTGIALYLAFYNYYSENSEFKLVYGFRNEEDNILNYFNEVYKPVIMYEYTKSISSKKQYVYDYLNLIEEGENECCVIVCGNPMVQKDVYLKIKLKYPKIIETRKLIFDSWQ